MKNGIIVAGIIFAATLTVVVGQRLSNEAMAVVVGAVCGISASIPMSLGLAIAVSRNWERGAEPRETYVASRTRRVVIITPPDDDNRD